MAAADAPRRDFPRAFDGTLDHSMAQHSRDQQSDGRRGSDKRPRRRTKAASRRQRNRFKRAHRRPKYPKTA
eukprot:2413223-Pyramimonas_sp.AAC.1